MKEIVTRLQVVCNIIIENAVYLIDGRLDRSGGGLEV